MHRPVYQNDTLQFISHEEGRMRFKPIEGSVPASFAFDYFIKDHLGNVRMVLTEQKDTTFYPAATMETANATVEEQLYAQLPETRTHKFTVPGYPTDNTTSPNSQVAKVSGATGEYMIGPAITLKVMAGDKFNLRVSSWYKTNGQSPGRPRNPLEDLLTSLISGVSGAAGGKATVAELTNSGVFTPGVGDFLTNRSGTGTKPQAYLNWILFDEQFKLVSSSSGAEQVGDDQEFKIHTKPDLPIDKNGYLYIYVSNETPNIPVFFDNLQVTHIRGPILEETHYYPFGLTMAGISSKAAGGIENKKKFNGIEFDNDLDLNTYEAFFRNLDPQTGRWWQIDPKADSLLGQSPYNAMVNNPISITDPRGDIIEFDKNASAEYKAKVLVAAITLLIKGVGDNLIQLDSSKRTYTFSESKTLKSSFLGNENGQGGVVSWNPNVGLLTSNKIKLSATTLLNHELDHAVHYDNNPSKYFEEKKSSNYFDVIYDNIEEKRVITGSEQVTARAMGEITGDQVTRTDHQAFGTIATRWPNSTNGAVTPISGFEPNIIIKSKKRKSKN